MSSFPDVSGPVLGGERVTFQILQKAADRWRTRKVEAPKCSCCGYSLRGHVALFFTFQCPECGREHDRRRLPGPVDSCGAGRGCSEASLSIQIGATVGLVLFTVVLILFAAFQSRLWFLIVMMATPMLLLAVPTLWASLSVLQGLARDSSAERAVGGGEF